MSSPLPAARSDPADERAALSPRWRAPLLALGLIALIMASLAGLARLGWPAPDPAASMSAQHGSLMICGFFGLVISLERAVALGGRWAYLGPLFAALGVIAALAGIGELARWLFFAASLALAAASWVILQRQPVLFMFVIALGALCWAIGNGLWATGSSVHEVVLWWLAFPILTIAGERLDLSRFLPPSAGATIVFVAIVTAIAIGLASSSFAWGATVFGAGLLALSAWLAKQDIARRTVRGRGLTRFTAVCLLSGYVWLAAGGAIILAAGGLVPSAVSYDAALHALLLGFVFAMVFGHAPIIFPAVLRVAVPYHPYFYFPLALLHASLVARLAGDALDRYDWTRVGGLLNVIALAAFIVGTVTAVIRGQRAPRRAA